MSSFFFERTNLFTESLSTGKLAPPLSAFLELRSSDLFSLFKKPHDVSGYLERLTSLISKLWEVHPVINLTVFPVSSVLNFIKWCNSAGATVSINFSFCSLSPEKIECLLQSSLHRLTIVVDKLASPGKEGEEWYSDLGKAILKIREN